MKTKFYFFEDHYSDMYWFMQVVKETAKTVTLRKVCSSGSGRPIENEWKGYDETITRRVGADGRVSYRNGSWAYGMPWNGEAFSSNSVWGHNYNLY